MPEVEISAQAPPPSRDDIARNWGESQISRTPGRSAKKRQSQVQALVRRMQAETRRAPDGRIEGPLRPCTVVNFNPVALVVEGQLRITIPKPGTTAHHQIRMPYKGRVVQGHYCYIASAHIVDPLAQPDQQPIYYTVTTGHEVDSILPIDVPTVAARVFSPHSIACELWSQYNSPSHKLMGGILLFDQGPHTLKAANLAHTGNKIWVPTRSMMEDEGLYTYGLRETLLEDELDRIFEVQRSYCDVILQSAHSLWAEQDVASRKMVTDTHREWARWALSMGYLQQLPEWVNAKLVLGADITELRVCRYCGTQQANETVYFCHKCNAPFNPFKAFMDGLAVPESYLMTLEGDELEAVLRTLEERKRRFAGGLAAAAASTPAESAENPPAGQPGPATGKAGSKSKARAGKNGAETGRAETGRAETGRAEGTGIEKP